MPTTRNIIGDFRFEVALGKRTCDASSKHIIEAGEKHFAYEKVPGQRINICMHCTPKILTAANEHLASLIRELN